MEIDYNLIGERLKKARLQKGFSQVKLSEMLDISEVYLSRIEKEKTRISLKRLVQMSEILDISISEVITGSAEKSKEYPNINKILNNINLYPASLIELASQNDEAIDFVANYPEHKENIRTKNISIKKTIKREIYHYLFSGIKDGGMTNMVTNL